MPMPVNAVARGPSPKDFERRSHALARFVFWARACLHQGARRSAKRLSVRETWCRHLCTRRSLRKILEKNIGLTRWSQPNAMNQIQPQSISDS